MEIRWKSWKPETRGPPDRLQSIPEIPREKPDPVLVFSLEMPNDMLALRILSSESRIPIGRIESAEWRDLDVVRWHELKVDLTGIDDEAGALTRASDEGLRLVL